MNMCRVFLKLPEFLIYLFFLVLQKTDDVINVLSFVRFIFKKFPKLWNCHTGTFKTVDAVETFNSLWGQTP